MIIKVDVENKKIFVKDPQSISLLQKSKIGKIESRVLYLSLIEALYLIDFRNAKCIDKQSNKEIGFNDLANLFDEKKQLARYLTYAAWRSRGLIAKEISPEDIKDYKKSRIIQYKGKKLSEIQLNVEGYFYKDDLILVIEDKEKVQELYKKYWFGQIGEYKAEQKAKIAKFDVFETIFLAKHANLKILNCNLNEIVKLAKQKHSDFEKIYQVYEDWRMNGFVLKTGFKFGTHFRVYFPKQNSKEEWDHSKHVLEVFSRQNKQIIYKWARAIRLAHSVKKTFVLAIDGQKKDIKKDIKIDNLDFILYPRKSENSNFEPEYLMLSLSEDEYLSGEELAKAIENAKAFGLNLIVAIADRESSVTFYLVSRINIPQSDYEYYQFEWILP